MNMCLAIEDMLDGLFQTVFLNYNLRLADKGKRPPRTKTARVLHELLEGSGGLGFDRKLKLARIVGFVSPMQFSKLDELRRIRNRCAHNWMLDVVYRKKTRNRPSMRVLEYRKKSLFELPVLTEFTRNYVGFTLDSSRSYLPNEGSN